MLLRRQVRRARGRRARDLSRYAGASLYFTVATRQACDPVGQWLSAKAAASEPLIDNRASSTHHHAVGRDHKPWLAREIGPVGV